MKSEQQYIDLYTQASQLIKSKSVKVMNDLRDEAFMNFKKLGFPSKKEERYKYTNIHSLFEPNYGLNLNRLEIPIDPYKTFKCGIPNLSTSLYFIVNDQLYTKKLPNTYLGEGVIIDSLAKAATHYPELITKYYGKLAKTSEDGITALNTMLAQDGLFIYVPKNIKLKNTVQIVNILRSDVDLMVNRRVLIILEEGAEGQFLFCDDTADNRKFLTTQVIEAFVGNNAHLDLNCLEETHTKNVRISNAFIQQESYSKASHNVITLHNGITRNMLNLTFKGQHSECFINGCIIADKEQHVDNNTLIDHAAPHCQSHELYKYVLNDKAVGAFAGLVLVRKEAQKTTSIETNRNLVSTNTARMYSQPMLEIYADDVQCNHGSTVGQLNDAALFYMQQRGIDQQEARTLLQTAFIYEVIDKIELDSLRERLHLLVEKRFRGELNKCNRCKICK